MEMNSKGWRAQIIDALKALGGNAFYKELYTEINRKRESDLTSSNKAGIRREIENHSSDSANYKPWRPDLFRSVGGIKSGHWGLRQDPIAPNDKDAVVEFREGEKRLAEVSLIGRSKGLVKEARQHHGLNCTACGFNFEAVYGEIGQGFIEVHHLYPISYREEAGSITLEEVTVLCANCHRMAHTSRPPLTIEELQNIIRRNRS